MNKKEKHEEYVNEKTHFAYSKYLKGEYFEKARAIIVKDGKVALLRSLSDGSVFMIGGGVDEGETVEQAVIREAFEETGMKVKPIMQLQTNYYEWDLECDGNKFVSKRVEYIYLCQPLEEKASVVSGLEGEYDEAGVEMIYADIEKLADCRVNIEGIAKIREYINQKNAD